MILRFIGSLALKTGGNRIEFELPASTTLGEAASLVFKTYRLGNIEANENEATSGYVQIFLNRKAMPNNQILKEDDEISFLPPLTGG
ncbi:MAG: MoaD/ThiS family protein [Candidatus Bathycorpusculaceae bacterium]